MKGDDLKFLNNFLPIYAKETLGIDIPFSFCVVNPSSSLRARPGSTNGGGKVYHGQEIRKVGISEVTALRIEKNAWSVRQAWDGGRK